MAADLEKLYTVSVIKHRLQHRYRRLLCEKLLKRICIFFVAVFFLAVAVIGAGRYGMYRKALDKKACLQWEEIQAKDSYVSP